MSKYEPIYYFLNSSNKTSVILSYEQIEKIINAKLPGSAFVYREWWDNNSHVQSIYWRKAGYLVTDIALGKSVRFTKEQI